MGGRSSERQISLKTGQAVYLSLIRQGFKAFPIDASLLLPLQLKQHRVDFAYIALHGTGGEDGSVQGLLEWLGVPYTGSGVMASALAMDKVASKRLFSTAGLATAAWTEIDSANANKATSLARKMGFPIVIKPSNQGSALGVSIVHSSREVSAAVRRALRLSSTALLERYLKGPEITVGVLGPLVLPIIEIVPSKRAFYDYHAKYARGGSRHIFPAQISTQAAKLANSLTLEACRVLGIRAVARVDLIVDDRQGPTLLEVNTIPGMTETSLLPDAARAAGIDFDELVLKIMEYSVAA